MFNTNKDLLKACKARPKGSELYIGDINAVRKLVKKKDFDPNYKAPDGNQYAGGQVFFNTPIYEACLRPNLEIVQELLSHGVDPNSSADSRGSLFHALSRAFPYEYIREQTLGIARLLIEKGANKNEALKWALKHEQDDLAQELIVQGAELDGAMQWASYNLGMLALLLDAGADPDEKNDQGEVPLHYVSDECKLALLYRNAADTAVPGVLHRAVNNLEITTWLLDAGADPNEKDNQGRPPIHCGCGEGVLELLLDRGAEVDATDKDGLTLLDKLWLQSAGSDWIDLLFNYGANIHLAHLNAAFAAACKKEDIEYVDLLLKHGADINHLDQEGRTAFARASVGFATQLLERGATPEIRDDKGQTPFSEMLKPTRDEYGQRRRKLDPVVLEWITFMLEQVNVDLDGDSYTHLERYAMNQREVGEFLKTYTLDSLIKLNDEIIAFNEEHPDQVFDFLDPDRAQLTYRMLVQLVGPCWEHLPFAQELAEKLIAIPSIVAIIEASPWELLRLAQPNGRINVVLQLLNIPKVKEAARKVNYNRPVSKGVSDNYFHQAINQAAVTFISRLKNPEEAQAYFDDMLENGVGRIWDNIRDESKAQFANMINERLNDLEKIHYIDAYYDIEKGRTTRLTFKARRQIQEHIQNLKAPAAAGSSSSSGFWADPENPSLIQCLWRGVREHARDSTSSQARKDEVHAQVAAWEDKFDNDHSLAKALCEFFRDPKQSSWKKDAFKGKVGHIIFNQLDGNGKGLKEKQKYLFDELPNKRKGIRHNCRWLGATDLFCRALMAEYPAPRAEQDHGAKLV